MTYAITINLSVDEDAEHLGDAHEIEDEVRCWLEGLGATVNIVDVQQEAS